MVISKKFSLSLLSVLFAFNVCIGQTPPVKYNKSLADSLGADAFGMKPYILVILKTGSFVPPNKHAQDSLFKGHMESIKRLSKEGKLVVAGPLGKNEKNYRGIFILNVKTIEEAKELLQNDPTIQTRVFDMELYSWYGSAALPLYLPHHNSIEKQSH